MSTDWHLQCLSHDPPLLSDGEVSQHNDHRLDRIRQMWAQRDNLAVLWPLLQEISSFDDSFYATAWWFISRHRHCRVQFLSEYGDVESIEAEVRADG